VREKSIVTPSPWRGLKARRAVFVPFDLPGRTLHRAVVAGKPREISRPYARAYLGGDRVTIYGALGAPLTAIIMEELIASGVKEFLLLGVGGSLSEDLVIATPVCVTKAFSEEGTSRMYHSQKRAFFPSPQLKRMVQLGLTARGQTYEPGVVVTVDAPYRETASWVRRNRRRGAVLVDMETSAVFSVAEHHGCRAASLLVVSDELVTGTWKNGLSDPRLDRAVSDCLAPFLG
jgi:uridine phosphorylase